MTSRKPEKRNLNSIRNSVSQNNTDTNLDKKEENIYNIGKHAYRGDFLLSLESVADFLNVGLTTVRGLINQKLLVAVKLKNRTLVRNSDLEKFINELEEYEGRQNGF